MLEKDKTPITNLQMLLSNLVPTMSDNFWVFTKIGSVPAEWFASGLVLATFKEAEATTLVCSEDFAIRHDLEYQGVYRCITCNVYSSLEAVGMTAAISAKLTEFGISANVIAAYHHDHIFVPASKADLALKAMAEFKLE